MSKFERYKKQQKNDYYVYPHKHCQKCGEMIEESVNYCSACYEELKKKKNKKGFLRKIRRKKMENGI